MSNRLFERAVAAFIASFLIPVGAAQATEASRAGVIDAVGQNAANRPGGYEEITFLYFTGSWSGTSCAAGLAYFNGKNNPHLLAMALSTKLAGRSFTITVDDALPKWGGTICQVVFLKLEP